MIGATQQPFIFRNPQIYTSCCYLNIPWTIPITVITVINLHFQRWNFHFQTYIIILLIINCKLYIIYIYIYIYNNYIYNIYNLYICIYKLYIFSFFIPRSAGQVPLFLGAQISPDSLRPKAPMDGSTHSETLRRPLCSWERKSWGPQMWMDEVSWYV